MSLIIETDIGRDSDDLFAVLYLISTGMPIRAITVSPGDPDQIALVKFILDETGLDIPVGSDNPERKSKSLTPYHGGLMDRYKYPRIKEADGYGPDIIAEVLKNSPDTEFLVIGPPNGIGRFLLDQPDIKINYVTIQGGFIGYDVHGLKCRRLKIFEDKTTFQSFNLNGDLKGTKAILSANILRRQFVSKNVNHTVVFGVNQYEMMNDIKPKNRSMELFQEAANKLNKRKGKKFHDPVAAVCHLHPEVATWVNARLYSIRTKANFVEWGSELIENGDRITIDIDYDRFWELLLNGK